MEDRSSPQAIDSNPRSPVRTVQVLHELAISGQGVALAALAARLQLPKTSLFRLLRSLEQGGYVTSSNGVHQVGPQAIKLGVALVQNREFPNCARPAMEWLAAECNETVILGTFDDSGMQIVYTEVIEPSNPLRFSIKSGLTKPLYSSAMGQTLLAYMPAERKSRYLQHVEFVRLASRTISSWGIEGRVCDRFCFKLGDEGFGLLFGARERSQPESITHGEDNPFPPSRVHQLAGRECCRRAHRGFPPSRTDKLATAWLRASAAEGSTSNSIPRAASLSPSSGGSPPSSAAAMRADRQIKSIVWPSMTSGPASGGGQPPRSGCGSPALSARRVPANASLMRKASAGSCRRSISSWSGWLK